MLAAAIGAVGTVLYFVNRKRVRIEFMFLWLVIAAMLLLVALFPGIVTFLCGIMGIRTPSNLIYLFGIFILLWITFRLTVVTSWQAEEIKRLTQIVSIEKHRREKDTEHENCNS